MGIFMKFSVAIGNKKAFTIVELLLVVALIALFAGIIASAVAINSSTFSARAPDRVFLNALKRARFEASSRGREISITFDNRGFLLLSDSETSEEICRLFLKSDVQKIWESASKEGSEPDWSKYPNRVEMNFYIVPPRVIGSTTREYSEMPVRRLRMSPNTSMTPSKVEIREEGCPDIALELDPFCAAEKI